MTDTGRPTDHLFTRHPDPRFGSAFGGGCGAVLDGVTCGWPERFHPTTIQEPASEEKGEVPA